MSIINRCYPILCYIFMFVIITIMRGINYKFFSFFSFLFRYVDLIMYNMLNVYKLENKVLFHLFNDALFVLINFLVKAQLDYCRS